MSLPAGQFCPWDVLKKSYSGHSQRTEGWVHLLLSDTKSSKIEHGTLRSGGRLSCRYVAMARRLVYDPITCLGPDVGKASNVSFPLNREFQRLQLYRSRQQRSSEGKLLREALLGTKELNVLRNTPSWNGIRRWGIGCTHFDHGQYSIIVRCAFSELPR
jgi:hypothetical protein